mmetsp:Transcript_2751/g.7208  ORF Transcript_2751/g.7208 Transcript_2751/m.7208 type:complete len:212 (-) Transcript_2751:881-1516(-)
MPWGPCNHPSPSCIPATFCACDSTCSPRRGQPPPLPSCVSGPRSPGGGAAPWRRRMLDGIARIRCGLFRGRRRSCRGSARRPPVLRRPPQRPAARTSWFGRARAGGLCPRFRRRRHHRRLRLRLPPAQRRCRHIQCCFLCPLLHGVCLPLLRLVRRLYTCHCWFGRPLRRRRLRPRPRASSRARRRPAAHHQQYRALSTPNLSSPLRPLYR